MTVDDFVPADIGVDGSIQAEVILRTKDDLNVFKSWRDLSVPPKTFSALGRLDAARRMFYVTPDGLKALAISIFPSAIAEPAMRAR